MRRVLNSKERKLLHRQLREQFGFSGRIMGVLVLQERKQKLSLMTEEAALFPTDGLRIETAGVYFGAYVNGQVRLSIEGSQVIGPCCSKNIVELSQEQMREWMQGATVAVPAGSEAEGFVLVKHGTDFLGCGKRSGERILNYIPKTRYVHALY